MKEVEEEPKGSERREAVGAWRPARVKGYNEI